MKKYMMETTVGIFVVIGLLSIGYMTMKLGEVSLFGDNSYLLYARFTSVSGLRVGIPVEMLGLAVGRVEQLTIDQEREKALVEMKIKRGVNVYADAIASVKTIRPDRGQICPDRSGRFRTIVETRQDIF